MSSLRKRGVRLKRFNSSSSPTTATHTTAEHNNDILLPPSPPSSTSVSELSTPPPSDPASSDSLSPLTPSLSAPPSRTPTSQRPLPGSVLHTGSDVDGHLPDAAEEVERNEHISYSLSTLSSMAPRLPPGVLLPVTSQLQVGWERWVRLPVNIRCAGACVTLMYCVLFSFHTHVILLLFYATVAFTAFAVRDEVLSVARRRGLLSLLPHGAVSLLSDYNLMELFKMALSSTLTSDVLLLLCFQLTEAEQRAVLQRIPSPYSEVLVRQGIVHLLPQRVHQLLYPAPHGLQQRSAAIHVALYDADDSEMLEEKHDEGHIVEERQARADDPAESQVLADLSTVPSDMMERKYDEGLNSFDVQLRDWPASYMLGRRSMSAQSHQFHQPHQSHQSPQQLSAFSPLSILSTASKYSVYFDRQSSYASSVPPPSPAPSDFDDIDPASVTLSRVIDRQLSSSLKDVFRSWAKQCYTALYDSSHELLPNLLTSHSSLRFFVPLATSIVALHTMSLNGRVRALVRRSPPYVIDGIMCGSALLAAHHLYVLLVERFNRRREVRRWVASGGSVAVSDGEGDVAGAEKFRLWLLYVYRKCRNERGVFVSGVVLLCWLLYLAKARKRVWLWLELRELQRRGTGLRLV